MNPYQILQEYKLTHEECFVNGCFIERLQFDGIIIPGFRNRHAVVIRQFNFTQRP